MNHQRGGTFLGFVLGVLVGLGAALAVAVYVTKVPVPFLDRGAIRPVDQDASETKKNKDWDPNAPLYGKNPARPTSNAEQVLVPTKAGAASDAQAVASKAELKPAVTADPLGDLARAKSTDKTAQPAGAEPFVYFVQVGAYRTPEDAEGQRAKLQLAGIDTKVSERDQAGRTVYRVRTGPFETRDEADKAKARLDASGLDTALVRVQR
jgi:cell division protein FtsN